MCQDFSCLISHVQNNTILLAFTLSGLRFTHQVLAEKLLLLSRASHIQLYGTPWTVAFQAPLFMGFPSKNTGVGCHFLLQGIFLTQGLNPVLLHCRWILLSLSHQGSSPRKVISKRLSLISLPYRFLYLLCSSYHAAYLYFLPYLLH